MGDALWPWRALSSTLNIRRGRWKACKAKRSDSASHNSVSLLGQPLGCILAPGVSEQLRSFLSRSFIPSYKVKSEAGKSDGPDLKPDPRPLALGTGPGPIWPLAHLYCGATSRIKEAQALTASLKFPGKVASPRAAFRQGLAGIRRSWVSWMNGHPASILRQGRSRCKVQTSGAALEAARWS